MPATNSSVQILKENEDRVVLKVVGATGPETGTTLVDASTFTGATGVTNLLSVNQLEWNINDNGLISLSWDGSTDANLAKLSRNGIFQFKRLNNTKIDNNATAPNGDILMTTTTGNFTLMMELEKVGDGWTK